MNTRTTIAVPSHAPRLTSGGPRAFGAWPARGALVRCIILGFPLACLLCGAAEKSEDDHDHVHGHDWVEPSLAAGAASDHDAEHDHAADHGGQPSDEEPRHAHDEHGADDHEDEGLSLSPEQRERFGIVVRAAGPGSLRNDVTLPGEVVFNGDGLVHMVPPVSGIARRVLTTVGDSVKAGDVLAVIDSIELASAKLAYIAAVTEVGCCQFELPRAQAIHDNAMRMLLLLESAPSVEQLRDSLDGETGEYGNRLVSAYVEYVQTRKTYERERVLMIKEVSSEEDFLAAESAFKKAQADYFGTRDSVAFEVRQDLLEATRDRQLAELAAQTAELTLHVLGLSEAEIGGLKTGTTDAGDDLESTHACTDPNCTDCQAEDPDADGHASGSAAPHRQNLGWYEIKAPIDGVVVERHLALGEHVGEDSDIFTIADLTSVWVNLTVYTKDLLAVRKGQDVVLRAEHSGTQARGRIAMVTPFVEPSTRSATARVPLDNRDAEWMPGTFVAGHIGVLAEDIPLVVPRSAVQNIEGRYIVFIEHEGAFEAVPVTIGRSDGEHVEIVAGLEPGAPYVAEGAFQLKATVVTGALGSHAGHGH
jgi:cobalt-zinc-cadmium efflux system membrane fusion protein